MDFEVNPKVVIIYMSILFLSIGIAFKTDIPTALVVGSIVTIFITIPFLSVDVE